MGSKRLEHIRKLATGARPTRNILRKCRSIMWGKWYFKRGINESRWAGTCWYRLAANVPLTGWLHLTPSSLRSRHDTSNISYFLGEDLTLTILNKFNDLLVDEAFNLNFTSLVLLNLFADDPGLKNLHLRMSNESKVQRHDKASSESHSFFRTYIEHWGLGMQVTMEFGGRKVNRPGVALHALWGARGASHAHNAELR